MKRQVVLGSVHMQATSMSGLAQDARLLEIRAENGMERLRLRLQHAEKLRRERLDGNEPAVSAPVDALDLFSLSEAIDRLETDSRRRRGQSIRDAIDPLRPWARAAFAGRCARRVRALFERACAVPPCRADATWPLLTAVTPSVFDLFSSVEERSGQ